MGKKVEKLRHLVKKLAIRYGEDDADVARLRAEIDALGERQVLPAERRVPSEKPVDFQSATKRLYRTTTGGDTHMNGLH
jgi:hypothetical protein